MKRKKLNKKPVSVVKFVFVGGVPFYIKLFNKSDLFVKINYESFLPYFDLLLETSFSFDETANI